ncbi:hypothetical protein EC973_005981 [Apophysomyces ossiformis]|uniref:Uncharacterized protein n=1 Tax=Apophysomyces ossiformis TaxID=679940 RepID=A0A8H7BJZ8_9FUNG|nr:hypothetical protein EC973_005981 [Apophysomyces ossiformis]
MNTFELPHDQRSVEGWLMILLSSTACVLGASLVFIDHLWKQQGASILDSRSFQAASMALASESQERLTSQKLVFLSFFGGALVTLLLSRLIHRFTPAAIHTCNASSESIVCCDEDHQHHSLSSHHNHSHHHLDNGKRQKSPVITEASRHHHHRQETGYGSIPFSESHFQFHAQEQHPHSPHHHDPEVPFVNGAEQQGSDAGWNRAEYTRVGIQTAVAICIHKFPEGLIMFISNQASTSLGVSVSIAIAIHNLTEGFMIALPLYYATGSKWAAFTYAAVLGGFSQPLGALLGLLAIKSVEKVQEDMLFGITFGITSGMMSMITIQGLLPQAIKADSRQEYVLGFFFLGIFLVGLSSILQDG